MLCLQHPCKTPGQVTPQHNTIILAKLSRCMDGIIRKATEIDLHPNNINKTDGFSLLRSERPLIRNMMPPVGPEKDRFFSYFTSNTAPLSVICLKAPYWCGSFFPYLLSLIGPFPSGVPSSKVDLYKPYNSKNLTGYESITHSLRSVSSLSFLGRHSITCLFVIAS
jgi:hypothetical protein